METSGLFYYGDGCHKSLSSSEDVPNKCGVVRYYDNNSQLQRPVPAQVLEEMYLLPSSLLSHCTSLHTPKQDCQTLNFHFSGFHSCTSLWSFNLPAFTPNSWSSIAACVQAITGYHLSYKTQDKYLLNCGRQLLPFNTVQLVKSRYRSQNIVICQVFTDYESWTSIIKLSL